MRNSAPPSQLGKKRAMILIFGSINADVVVPVPHLPRPFLAVITSYCRAARVLTRRWRRAARLA
jgi:hypothetical protein